MTFDGQNRKKSFYFSFEGLAFINRLMAYSKNITKRKGLFCFFFDALIRVVFLCCFFSLSVLSSCHNTKTADQPIKETPKEAESLPDEPSRLIRFELKEKAIHQLGNGGLGLFSIPQDPANAPPTIFSPDAFPKERNENPATKLNQ